ncbi:MAG TPA: hypothetical protein VGJ71_05615 [Candidatus Limnocylindrales bacterium]|jgi:hypothetical protein
MNRRPPRRFPAGTVPVVLFALALYVLAAVALTMAAGLEGSSWDGPVHPTPGLGL